MKTLKISLLAILFISAMSCDRDRGENLPDIDFSTEEAAEIITAALQDASNGLSEQLSDITENVTTNIAESFECGVTADSSFTKTQTSVRVDAEYDVVWEWTPICNDLDNMTALDYSSTLTGGYTGLRSSTEETKSTTFDITGMQLSSPVLTYDGNSLNQGTQTITIQGSKVVDSRLEMLIEEITVNKLDTEISNGTATFTLDVTLNDNEVVAFTGSIEFLGSQDVTITINGEVFEIDL